MDVRIKKTASYQYSFILYIQWSSFPKLTLTIPLETLQNVNGPAQYLSGSVKSMWFLPALDVSIIGFLCFTSWFQHVKGILLRFEKVFII